MGERVLSLLDSILFCVEQRPLSDPDLSGLVITNIVVIYPSEDQRSLRFLAPFIGLGKPVVVLLDQEDDFALEVLASGVQDVILAEELETIGRRLRYIVESFASTNRQKAKKRSNASKTTAEFTSAVQLLKSSAEQLTQTLDPGEEE
jgi:hypothetical protein